jgi:hypothetical protein
MIVIGFILLIAALVVGAAAVSANIGTTHPLTSGFGVFGHIFSGSTGMLFLGGIAVGAVGMLGLSLTFNRSWHSARGHAVTRRELRKAQRQASKTRPAAAPSK